MRKKNKWLLIGGTVLGGILAARFVSKKHQALLTQRRRNRDINVIIVGAGVIGRSYACHLANYGVNVSLLAKADQFKSLTTTTVWVRDILTRQHKTAPVSITSKMPRNKEFDLALLTVRYTQTLNALQTLKPLVGATPILIMQSNLAGTKEFEEYLGTESLLMGFPATAGMRIKGSVHSLPFWLGTTLIGESSGARTQRLQQTASILRGAGLRVRVKRHIVPWLQTQTAMTTVLAACIYRNAGSIRRMGRRAGEVHLYLEALREAFDVIEMNGTPVTPSKRRDFVEQSIWLSAALIRIASLTPWSRALIDQYFSTKADEMRAFYDQLLMLAERADVIAPALTSLQGYFE